VLRKVLSSSSAADAYEHILQQQQQQHHEVSTADVDLLLQCSLEAGNVDLALSVYQQIRAAKRAQAAGGPAAPASAWPAATLQHTETLVKGLCRQLRVNDALAVLRSIRAQGVPGTDEVG
jgi:pentatricopeptide repeat protein